MNNMFSMFNTFGMFGNTKKKYNPYINYTWEMLPNAKVKNSGTSGVDLQLYSGNPLDFQGSQSITINIQNANISNITFGITANTRTPIFGRADQWQSYIAFSSSSVSLRLSTTMSFSYVLPLGEYVVLSFNIDKTNNTCTLFENGNKIETVAITGAISGEILQLLSNMGSYFDGTINFITFNSNILTPTQIQQAYTNPNQFYNSCAKAGGELYANTIFCTDFGGTGGYVADDRNVSKVEVLNEPFDDNSNGWVFGGGQWEIANGVAKTTQPTSQWLYLNNVYEIGKAYAVSFEIKNYISGSVSIFNTPEKSSSGVYFGIVVPTTTYLRVSGNLFDGEIDNVLIDEISNIYPITNYSTTQRTNFTQESKGLQELMIERDSLGFFLGLREFPKGNGVGYGVIDGLEILNTEDFTVVANINILPLNTFRYFLAGKRYECLTVGVGSNQMITAILFGKEIYSSSSYFGETEITIRYKAVNNNFDVFINKVKDSSNYTYGNSSTENYYLFKLKHTDSYIFNEEIQKFIVHNKALTDEEIQEL